MNVKSKRNGITGRLAGTLARGYAPAALVALVLLVAPRELLADICCGCENASLSAPSQVNVDEAVAITYGVRFCRCVSGAAPGGANCHNSQNANCQLTPVDIQVFLDGGGNGVHPKMGGKSADRDMRLC